MDSRARAYRGLVPQEPMAAGEVVRLLEFIRSIGVTVWLDGGWGVDALLEEQRADLAAEQSFPARRSSSGPPTQRRN